MPSESIDVLHRAKTSLAAVFQGAGLPLELLPIPVPILQSGEALVQIECCTVCGSDLHTVSGRRQEPTPSILGHEILGHIVELGDPPLCDLQAVPLSVGDRVTWSTSISCAECDRCRQGMPQKCRSVCKYGHERAEGRMALSGGLSEQILLRRGSAVVHVSEQLPAEVICPVNCATATVAAAFRVAGPKPIQRVLIVGAGMLGLTASAFAHQNGASRIVVCDLDANRLSRAREFGATGTVAWHPDHQELDQRLLSAGDGESFDLIMEFSGSPDAVEAACRVDSIGVRIVLVGTVMKSRAVQLDPERIVRQWQSIHGVHNYAPEDLQTAIAFLTRSHASFPFAGLVEQTFPLAQVNEALDFAHRSRPVRVAIRP